MGHDDLRCDSPERCGLRHTCTLVQLPGLHHSDGNTVATQAGVLRDHGRARMYHTCGNHQPTRLR